MRHPLIALGLGLLTLTGTAQAAVPKVVGITGGVPYANIIERGETFFTARFHFQYDAGRVVLSSAADGTGDFYADDAMAIIVHHADGTTSQRSFDFSHGCSNNHFEPPMDVTGLFKPGLNKVTVKLVDGCGGAVYASPMFLSTQ